MSGLKLYLFGSPRLERAGESVHIVRRKATGLLAYLVTTQQHHSREALATVFWPEYDRRQGRADLSRTLSVLNKALGPGWLVADRETVSLNPETELWVDVLRFRQVQAARTTHGHPDSMVCAACLPLLAEAVALYRADFLAGFTLAGSPTFDDWQLFQTETLRRKLTGTLDRLGQGYSAQGDWETAISYAGQWVDLEPLHEPAHCLLMRLYAQSGQRTTALTQYETCRRLLDKELGVPPSQETQSLYEQIRLGEPAISAPAVAQPTTFLAKLPSFLAGGEAPVAGERPVFVARERELGRLDEHFQAALDGGGRVVFVTGEAGRGKTALLGEFARRAQANQADLIVATGNCSAYDGLGDPYLPFRDVMGMLSGDVEVSWAAGLITNQHALRLWTLLPQTVQALAEAGSNLIEVFVSGTALVQRAAARGLGETGQLQQLQALMQQIQAGTEALEQRHLFEQYTQVLRTLASRQPLLVLLDDLQWADSASINLLFHLGRRLAGSRILILGAYRPSEVALGRPVRASTGQDGQHPLKPVVNEFVRQFGDVRIDLGQMTPVEGRNFVEALLDSQPNRLSETFRAGLFERTQGHPLFTVELLRDMQERGDLIRDKEEDWIEGPTYPEGQGFPTIDMLAFQSHIPFCKSLQAQWRQNLGVDVNWRPLETSRYINKLADEQVHLCSLAWMADYPDPVNFLDLNDSIQMGQWHSQRFVALVDRARRETEPQQRMKLYGQADKILIEEAAMMPLTYGHKHVLVKPWVKKYPISAFKFWYWKDVVIEPH